MVTRLSTIILLIILLAVNSLAAGEGGYRSPFALGMGARQLGMGGATAAGINGSGSIYWNPAGLAEVKRSELQLSHMTLFMDTRYEFIAAAYPTLSFGAFGFGIGDLSSGEFERIDNWVSNNTTFSSRQDMLLLGYGFSLFRSLDIGLAVKGIYYDIAGYKDTGFGFDLGLIYSLGIMDGMSIGLKASDIAGPRIKLHTLEQRYPWSLRGGLAYSRELGEKNSLLLNADIENTEKLGIDIYVGAEFGLNEMFFARAGYMADKPTVGAGVVVAGIRFDYAFASLSDLETSHRLSLSYSFGVSVDVKRARRDEILVRAQIDEYRNNEEIEYQNKLQEELAEAHRLEQDGQTYQAIEAYYRVLGIDVQNEEAIGKVTLLMDQIKQNLAREASQGYTTQLITSQLDLGDSYLSNKQYDNAEGQFKLALILDPDNQHARDQLAAIENARKQDLSLIRTRAQTHMRNGDYELALESLNNILQAEPNDRQALDSQARIFKIVESSEYLDEALKYFDQSEYNRAIALVDSALALNPDSDGARSLKRQLNRYTAEETTLEDIKTNDAHWQIYLRGMEKYQAGEYNEAIGLWQTLLEFYPNNPNLSRNIDQATERVIKE
ncbi:MAG: PorV/PorQ family protein [candidate division Zixibacteria bacterium]|nr:PorV/PorQ family protein [candidate division Zixibacteria bacterium]